MNLYFLRHGLADWPNWHKPDDERPLTPEGIEKMKAEAKAIQQLDLGLTAILASPLIRARQTAQIVADRLDLEVTVLLAVGPGFNKSRLEKILREYPEAQALMFVGHEPDFSQTISALIGGGRVAMKKGGLARVEVNPRALAGELVWLLAPKVLAMGLS
jgi:phosphohistidine phosphatase